MAIVDLRNSPDSTPPALFGSPEPRTIASYERELTTHRCTQIRLREALARKQALLRQKDELIQQLAIQGRESDHRLLNGLQMIGSLLSLQSLASASVEARLQLAIAADRVATVGRVHRRLSGRFGGYGFGHGGISVLGVLLIVVLVLLVTSRL